MNSTKASQIEILSILNEHGFLPVNNRNHKFWFNSPFRNENKPSFVVDTEKNLWYDFGLGEGGNPITLIARLHNVTNKEAWILLTSKNFPSQCFHPNKPDPIPKNSSLKILKVKSTIDRPALIDYLHRRKIYLPGLKQCDAVNEIYYAMGSKRYFGIGFKNDKGGFEIRNAFWKGSSSPKAITTIKGHPHSLNVFEGFMDYLSALTYYQTSLPSHTSIVLNGTGQTKSLLALLPEYREVHLYLDNDEAGKRVVSQIKKYHPNAVNHSANLYPSYKDFNEFLCKMAQS